MPDILGGQTYFNLQYVAELDEETQEAIAEALRKKSPEDLFPSEKPKEINSQKEEI